MNLKKAVSLIISSIWCEESVREMNKPLTRVIKIGSEYKRVDVNSLIVEHLKYANDLIQKHHIKGNGTEINKMSYDLIEIFNEISYLSIENQNKVKEYVKGIGSSDR